MQRFMAARRRFSRSIGAALMLTVVFSGILAFVPLARPIAQASGNIISNVNTDKARYNPGDTVTIWVDMTNNSGNAISNGHVTLYYRHLDSLLSTSSSQTLNLNSGASATLSWNWTPPTTDYQGYLVEARVYDSSSTELDNYNTAVDVSSDWKRFPRYGYLSTYPSQSGSTSSNIIWQLKNYHIDALQFYDWQYKHHIPLAGTPGNPAASWGDIANRPTYRQTVLDYLNTAHNYNMLGFTYNAANAAYDNYTSDGVQQSWGLFHNSDCTGQDNWGLPSGWATPRLDLFDPSNTSWQNYIFSKTNDMFSVYPFDGWHVDQLVVGGSYRCSGQSFNIFDTFPGYLNNAKSSSGKRIIFNSSGGTASENVARQTANDTMYYEWFNNRRYWDMLDDVEKTHNWDANKQVVEALYMDQNHNGTTFNAPGVLLSDAGIFAAGGFHIELGDGNQMLDSGYFPDRSLSMSADLQRQLHNYYDFAVAYENLLRGGQPLFNQYSNNVVLSAGGNNLSVSPDSQPNTVYKIVRSGNGYDTINLMNLLNQSSTDMFDADGTKPAPVTQNNVTVKYYYGSGTVNGVNFASPDYQNGHSSVLSYTTGADGNGNYVTFTIPSLSYWDMIYINKTASSTAGQQLFFDDFEGGSTSQWTPVSGSWAVCQIGGNSKEYCASNTSENVSLAGNSSWTNYSVQSYVVGDGSLHTGVCLLGRVQDSNHFYQAELKDNGNWDIWKNDGGSWNQVASGNFSWSAGSYYLIRFDLNGSTLSMSYSTNYGSSWTTLGSGSDSRFSSGKIGLRAWGAGGRFDQIKVISD